MTQRVGVTCVTKRNLSALHAVQLTLVHWKLKLLWRSIMTKDVIEIGTLRTKRDLLGTVAVAEAAYKIPQCKLMQDFLAMHDLPWQAPMMLGGSLQSDLLHKLGEAMHALHEKVVKEQARLCVEYGVEKPDDLSHDRRAFFDHSLRSFIEKEDHYP